MITGHKTVIKGLTKESANEIYKLVNKEENRPLTGTLYPISEYEHEIWIKNVTTSQNQKVFMVLEKTTGKFLGTIGLKNFNYKNQNAELFISLYSPGGYGTDAVRTFVEYCFCHLNLHKIYLHVYEYNAKAIRCYEKAGFKREGVLLEHHFENRKYENVIVMGILFSD